MKKKVLLFFAMAMLSIVGAWADVIPSSYYSEPAAGTFYLYNVTENKFLMTAGISENNKALQTNPQAITLTSNGDGTYKFSGNADCFVKIGHYKGMWLWPNGTDTNVLSWTFNVEGTKTYKISATTTSTVSENSGTKEAGTYYLINESNLGDKDDAENAGVYALITEANYYSYLASTTTVPSYCYTTTPTAGTYYLYNIEKGGFIYRGGDGAYAGLKYTPAPLTLTSAGSNSFYIQFSDGKYLKTGEYSGYYVWTDAPNQDFAWTFESFHGVSGLFFVKCPLDDVDRYLYSTGIGTKGVNGWPTPDANKTNYAWALISEYDYTAWQNGGYTLDEATGYSAERNIEGVNVTMNKAMIAGVWNTFVVPFNMAIPSGWTVKEPTDFDGSTLFFGDASSIEAGKPYIVKPTEAVTSFSATGVTLKKDLEPTTVGEGTTVTMTGTYSKIDAIDYSTQDSYVIGLKDGVSSLYKVNSTVSLKPFRAYFTIPGVSSARIAIGFDDETTGIKNLTPVLSEGEGAVYNLQGRRVAQPTKGLYIVNGKKVVVK